MISIVIPVFNESEHLPNLLERIIKVGFDDQFEIIVVDDSYDDLTQKSAEPYKNKCTLQVIRRGKRLGLSSAVIKGFENASGNFLICMDGDGSHPPEVISELVKFLKNSEKMVVASRHVPGGGSSTEWSIIRKLISKICTVLVRPITKIKDPMSGFFAISREFFETVRGDLKPLSYKIGLEIAVKGNLKSIKEVPFKFEERKAGSSKVNISVILGMIYHFFLLYCWKIFKSKV